MMYSKSILICGGDKRQKYMYEYMVENGLDVKTFGLFYNDMEDIDNIVNFDVVILPVPVTRDGVYLNSERVVKLDDVLGRLKKTQIVLGGMHSGVVDFCKLESFQMRNAVPTAEGAIQVAMENTDALISNSNCAVFGYGRIGKVLSGMLKNLGADVTVYARKERDIELACAFGCKTGNIYVPDGIENVDVIFNTVPETVIGGDVLCRTKKDVLIVELASKPYGTDLEGASKMGRNVIVASGLPGKVAPKTAGKILYEVIMDILIGMEV